MYDSVHVEGQLEVSLLWLPAPTLFPPSRDLAVSCSWPFDLFPVPAREEHGDLSSSETNIYKKNKNKVISC